MRNEPINLVVEDALSRAVAEKIIYNTDNRFFVNMVWPNKTRTHSTPGSGYIFKNLNSFNSAAKHSNYFVLTDLDDRECAPTFLNQILEHKKSEKMILRIAVREVETWLLADQANLSSYLSISRSLIPGEPETIEDPKRFIFQVAKRSRKRAIREGIPPSDSTAHIGIEYNPIMIKFVQELWNFKTAAIHSDSLKRTIDIFDGKR